MAFTSDTKKSVDLIVPSVGAIAAGVFFVYKEKDRDTKFLVLMGAIVFVLLYVVTTQITKAILKAQGKPPPVALTGDSSSGINSTTGEQTGFDANGWCDRVHSDVYVGFFDMKQRDEALYEKMALFGNDDLIATWNAWRNKYYDEEGETMTEAIAAEWTMPFSPVYNNMNKIVERLKSLKCK
jgi:hypothetical protein